MIILTSLRLLVAIGSSSIALPLLMLASLLGSLIESVIVFDGDFDKLREFI